MSTELGLNINAALCVINLVVNSRQTIHTVFQHSAFGPSSYHCEIHVTATHIPTRPSAHFK